MQVKKQLEIFAEEYEDVEWNRPLKIGEQLKTRKLSASSTTHRHIS